MSASTSLKLAMRRLWMDHTVYTRLYIVSAFAQIPDAQTVAGRLLRNQEDIGNALFPFTDRMQARNLQNCYSNTL